MLFTYKPHPHDFEKLHQYIEHTVLKVWCKAKKPFSITLLHKDFRPMVVEVSKNKNDYLLSPIKEIYKRFQILTPAQIKEVRRGFLSNNAIEDLCRGNADPFLFKDLKAIDKKLHDHLRAFGKNLYMHLTNINACKNYAGDINDYYKKLVKKNKAELCPFCGLNDIKSHRLTKRDAFDHFFSKDKYPFNSVNPLNLAPMCDDCNKSYKAQYDPILDTTGNRRRIFYPFSSSAHKVKLKVSLTATSIKKMDSKDLTIAFSCNKKNDEAERWAELFGLVERYIDKCCKDKDGKDWYNRVVDEGTNYGKTAAEMYDIEIKIRKRKPLSENNFLRVPFLIACKDRGLI
jgi:hypothetical protein